MDPTSTLIVLAGSEDHAANLAAEDLERFWPSRRGHAFDEFCR